MCVREIERENVKFEIFTSVWLAIFRADMRRCYFNSKAATTTLSVA